MKYKRRRKTFRKVVRTSVFTVITILLIVFFLIVFSGMNDVGILDHGSYDDVQDEVDGQEDGPTEEPMETLPAITQTDEEKEGEEIPVGEESNEDDKEIEENVTISTHIPEVEFDKKN